MRGKSKKESDRRRKPHLTKKEMEAYLILKKYGPQTRTSFKEEFGINITTSNKIRLKTIARVRTARIGRRVYFYLDGHSQLLKNLFQG